MKMNLIFAAALTCTMFAMPVFAGQSGEPNYFIDGLRCDGGQYGMTLPPTLPKLLAMAPVLKQKIESIETWEGYTATRKTVSFSGLTLGLVTFSNDANRYSLASAKIESLKWAKLSPFHAGDTIESVRAKLGKIAEDDDQLRSTYTGENDSVRFETKAGIVKAVIYECYTG